MAVLADLLNASAIEYLVQAPSKLLGLSILVYTLLVICYRIWFHPLAKYPGPFVAKISNLWNLYHTVKADRPYVTQDLHEKYGDFVRLGPNFLSVNSHYALKDIYGIGKNTQKSAWYSNLQPGLRSVFNVVDKKIHSSKRNALAPAFTEKVFKKNEPYILKHIDRLVEIIGEECDKGQRGVCTMNIGKWANYLTYDIIGELTFSRDYGSLNGVDPDMPDCIDAQQFATMIVGVEPKIRLFRLQSLFFPTLGKRATEVQARVLQMLDQRLNAGDDGRQDYLWWLENSKDEDGNPVYSKEELFSESIILVAAGTESTSGQIAALMFYLSIYPEIQAELHRQLRQTYKAYEDIVIGPELDQLEYLQACYKESLRMSPGGAGILPRETCQGGVTISRGEEDDSEHLPAGIEIGTPTYTLHHDARYHPDPYAFNPERWIPSSVGSEAVERALLAYAPFSLGSRQCIGRRLARLEITLSIARLVWRFETSYVGSALDEDRLRTKGWKEYKIIDHFSFQRIGPVVHFRRRDGV